MSRVEAMLASALLVIAVTGATRAAGAAEPIVVSQKDRAFSVAHLQIRRGETVRFSNDDDFTHQIFVQSPSFSTESDAQDPGHTLEVTFPKAGSFDVQCHIHPKMHLRVDVR